MMVTAEAAKALGVKVVNGFTGSSIWHLLYSFPPVDPKAIERAMNLKVRSSITLVLSYTCFF
jgi:hypothetical protein